MSLPSDSRVPLCSDEVCVCSQIRTAGPELNISGLCVCTVCVRMTGALRHSPCCTSAVCWWSSNIEKLDNERDECKHQSSSERESDGEGGGGITQRRVGTCRGQQSLRCCSWPFPGWDLQPWVTCPAETQVEGGGKVRGVLRTHSSYQTYYISVYTGQQPAPGRRSLRSVSQCVRYLEHLCLAGVGVCVLFPGLLGVMLVLPLGPDLTGTTLELGSTLTALPRHIWKHTEVQLVYSVKAVLGTDHISVCTTTCFTFVIYVKAKKQTEINKNWIKWNNYKHLSLLISAEMIRWLSN